MHFAVPLQPQFPSVCFKLILVLVSFCGLILQDQIFALGICIFGACMSIVAL